MVEGQSEKGTEREGDRVRGGQRERGRGLMMGGWWVVSAKIKDQQGLMKDRVRELEGSGSKPRL